jgi:Holliday junction resolvase RusA-like endonuclease
MATTTLKITVNDIPPSNNKYMVNSHSFHVYRNQKQQWHWLVKAALHKVKKPSVPYARAVVTILYYFKDNRRHDPDNYSGKMILDPLVKEGVIVDDSFDVIELRIKKGGVDKLNPRTEIEITELGA